MFGGSACIRRGICFGLIFVSASEAIAAGLPFDPSLFPDESLITTIALNIIKSVGVMMDHHPYTSAMPLGKQLGLDAGLTVTMVKIPDSLNDALEKIGLGSDKTIPAIPVPKLDVHKGLGDMTDFGVSLIYFRGMRAYGADFKYTLSIPEEGPAWAVRLSYAHAEIGFVDTTTWTPTLMISKKLDFADPYLGISYQIISGQVSVTYPVTGGYTTAVAGGNAYAAYAFTGVVFNPPEIGLKIALEGSYSNIGADTLGIKFGLAF